MKRGDRLESFGAAAIALFLALVLVLWLWGHHLLAGALESEAERQTSRAQQNHAE
jgi:hypothetical protein